MPERPLTLREAAQRYRVAERWLRYLIAFYDIHVLWVGRDLRFDAVTLAQLDGVLLELANA